MEYCVVCQTQHQTPLKSLTCGCAACSEALEDWLRVQIEGRQSPIVCPSSQRHVLHRDEIAQLVPVGTLRKLDYHDISKALCQVEVKHCPARDCGYLGWTDAPIFCLSPYTCELCGRQWRDQDSLHWLSLARTELLSELWKDVMTNSCPKCRFPIEKAGGCRHMTCSQCTHQFCWICSQNYSTHTGATCSRVTAAKYGPVGVLGFLLWLKCVVLLTPSLASYLSAGLYAGVLLLVAYFSVLAWLAAAYGLVYLYTQKRRLAAGLMLPLFLVLGWESYRVLGSLLDISRQVIKAAASLGVGVWLPCTWSWIYYSRF